MLYTGRTYFTPPPPNLYLLRRSLHRPCDLLASDASVTPGATAVAAAAAAAAATAGFPNRRPQTRVTRANKVETPTAVSTGPQILLAGVAGAAARRTTATAGLSTALARLPAVAVAVVEVKVV